MISFSPKQILSIQESDAKINIWEGAVRSGKTYASLYALMKMITYGEPGEYAILTRTYDSFKRNILPQLYQMIGAAPQHYSGKRELHLWGKTVHIIGCDDERAESKIRGATFSGAYVDEISIIPQSVFQMLVSRCAIGRSQILGTTNPDSPFHWLKTDFLTDNPDVKSWQFVLEDNPNLTIEEIQYLKRQYKGLWYQRYIQGLWVQAQGSVYDFFSEKDHCIGWAPVDAMYHVVGIDYGTTNPCAFVLLGFNPNAYPNIWIEDEYYWDSKKRGRQKTDSEYAADLKAFIRGKNVRAIYLDPSAASFCLELKRSGITQLKDGDNDVLSGIRKVSDLLTNGTLKIVKGCTHLIEEIQSYVWDSKASMRGEEKPLKVNDHCFCEGTMVWTDKGDKDIKYIRAGDLVWTRSGLKKVLRHGFNVKKADCFDVAGREFWCTPDHKFFTDRGWIPIKDLIPSDTLYVRNESWESTDHQRQLDLTGITTDAIQSLKCSLSEIISKGTESISIERFGSSTMEPYQEDFIYITKMKTHLTMIYPTLNVSRLLSTLNDTHADTLRDLFLKLLTLPLKNGTLLQKEGRGIDSMPSTKDLERTQFKSLSAIYAEFSTQPPSHPITDFVRISVNLHGGESLELTMSLEFALGAIRSFWLTDMPDPVVAPSIAQECLGDRVVYNLEVEDDHEFFANGVLVKNSLDALRYAIFTHNYSIKEAVDWSEVKRKHFGNPHGF